MAPVRRVVAAVLLAMASGQLLAFAQEPTGDEREGPTASLPDDAALRQIQENPGDADGPDVFLLPDADGQLRRVLGYRYEDFIRAWQAERQGPATAADGWSLERLTLVGDAAGDSAPVTIRVEVRLQATGWRSIPLAMPELVVDEARIDGGDAQDYIAFDAKNGGYLAWLNGRPGASRTVVIEGSLPVASDGQRRRASLELPSAVASQIRFAADGAIEVESPANAQAKQARDDSATGRGASGQTRRHELELDGVRGRLALAWDRADADESTPAAGLDAAVETLLTVDPRRLVYDAALVLNSYGRPLHRVWIRLPQGATLTAGPGSPHYEATTLGSVGEGGADQGDRSIVEVRFRDPIAEPTTIRLRATRTARAAAAPTAEAVQDAGPLEVLGASRQTGAIALKLSDQLHAHWQLDGRIEQVELRDLPESLRGQSPTAGFATSDAAWNLSIHTQRRQRRLRVSPQYKLHLGADGATLAATFDYQITGGRLFELRIGLAGWELADQLIESGGAVDLNELHVTSEGELVLPLKDPDVQQVRLQLAVRRSKLFGTEEIPLLEPREATVANGQLAITSDSAWRVAVDAIRSVGLAPPTADEAADPSAEAALHDDGSSASPLPIVVQTTSAESVVAVDVTRRPRQVSAASTAAIRVENLRVVVDQSIVYQVRYQPVGELSLVVPPSLLESEAFSVAAAGVAIPMGAIDVEPPTEPQRAGVASPLRMTVHLPRPATGRVTLTLHSERAIDAQQATGASPVELPLAQPEMRSASVVVATGREDFRFDLWPAVERNWQRETDLASAERDSVARFVGRDQPSQIVMRLEHSHGAERVETRVDAIWAQTWIAGGQRQDRVAFRVRPGAEQLRLAMPDSWLSQPAEVLVDGAPTRHELLASGVLAIPVSASTLATLELRVQSPAELAWQGAISLDLPVIEGPRTRAPFYWHAVLPRNYTALGTPDRMTGEYRVGWQDGRWGRQPSAMQADLERWAGASTAAVPAPSTSQYVFSALEAPDQLRLTVVRQTWLVVVGALAALGLGLAALATSAARSRAFWLAIAAAAAVVGLNYPEVMVVAGQAAGAGLALVLLAVVIRRLLSEPHRPSATPPSTHSPGSFVTHASTTQPWTAEVASSSVRATASSSLQTSGARP